MSRRRVLAWSIALGAGLTTTYTVGKKIAEAVPELSPIEASVIDGPHVKVDLQLVSDGHLHRFAYPSSGGTEVRFIVIQKNPTSFGTGLDACEICGPSGYYERDGQGTFRMNANPVVTWRPSRAVRLEGGVRFNRNDDDAQWVENVDDAAGVTHYVFGRLEQRTVAMTLRANYTVSPTLSFQAYAEPFVSAGRYGRFRELTNGRAATYEDRFQPYAYADNADFNYRSFRTTNVLRWEYKPGSALFVVWQQGRQDDGDRGDFRFGRDFGGLFGSPSRNVFLVKFSYWINS